MWGCFAQSVEFSYLLIDGVELFLVESSFKLICSYRCSEVAGAFHCEESSIFQFFLEYVFPQGLAAQPGGALSVEGTVLPDPDQNQPLTIRGCRLGSVKHLEDKTTPHSHFICTLGEASSQAQKLLKTPKASFIRGISCFVF